MTTYLVVAGLTRRLVEGETSEQARAAFVEAMKSNGPYRTSNRELTVARDELVIREATESDKAEFGRKRRRKPTEEERLPMDLPPVGRYQSNPT